MNELLGFRGPLLSLVSNLLWALAFNTVYLCVFAFTTAKFRGALGLALARLRPRLPAAPAAVRWVVTPRK